MERNSMTTVLGTKVMAVLLVIGKSGLLLLLYGQESQKALLREGLLTMI